MSDWSIVKTNAAPTTGSDWSIVKDDSSQLPSIDSTPLPLTKEQKIAQFKSMAGLEGNTPFDIIKNIAVGLGRGGQNIASTLTRGYAPTVNMEQTFGVDDQNRNNLLQNLSQYAPMLAAGTLSLPAEIAANTAYGATQDPNSPVTGGLLTGGLTGTLGILNRYGPIAKAIARTLAGAGIGYSAGGAKGATLGAGAGLFAPTALRSVGVGKDIGKDISSMINPEDLPRVQERVQAANELGYPITPGEASGRPDIRAREINLGRYGSGATTAYNIGQERMGLEKNIIGGLKNEIIPAGRDSNYEIRDAAKTVIGDLKDTRSAATSPFYEAAKTEEIPQAELDDLIKTPRIKNTMHEVLSDPEYAEELKAKPPTGKKMVAMVENRIDNLIDKAKSRPYNKDRIDQLQFAKDNFVKDYGDPQVQSVLKEIYQDDPVFQATAMGINPRSIEFLDTVKKRIDTASENAGNFANRDKDSYKAGLISKASKKITSVADQYSPSYQKARSIHQAMTPEIESAENSTLGTLANLKDTQLSKASGMVFDPAQTNIRTFARIKNAIMRKNPKAWDGIVRTEIERLNKSGNVDGVNFYQNVFKNANTQNQFELALDHKPTASRLFSNIKTAWADISRPSIKATTSAEREKISMNGFRDSLMTILHMIADQTSSKQQQEALKYLYSPRWQADVLNARATKNIAARTKQLATIFAKVIPPAYILPKEDNNNG